MFNNFLNFKIKCYEVPPCPRCTSTRTGRFLFVMNNSTDIERLMASYMKKGELVKPILGFVDTEHPNLFCEDCGAEWFADIYPRYVTQEELEDIKLAKGISKTTYKNMKNHKDIQLRNKREQKHKEKQEKKQKHKELRKSLFTNKNKK